MKNINQTLSNANKTISDILDSLVNDNLNIEHFNNVLSSIHKELLNFNTNELLEFEEEIADLREKITSLSNTLIKEQDLIKKQLLELNKQKEGMSGYIHQNNMTYEEN